MIGDERVPPFAEKFMAKAKKDPLVPIGALATLGFLVSGIYSFKQGNRHLSQKLMRGRVLAQGFTVVVMFAGLVIAGRPEVQRQTMQDKVDAVNMQPNKWSGTSTATAAAASTLPAKVTAPEGQSKAETPAK